MATYAAFKHVELYNVGNTKKRVLKPPGGGSSDIFGSDSQNTPRLTNKNHLASTIFAAPDQVSRNGAGLETPRRNRPADSHNRLFGSPDRPYTPAKSQSKSNIPIGGDEADNKGSIAPSPKSSSTSVNGHSNGKVENGSSVSNGNKVDGNPVTGEGYAKVAQQQSTPSTVSSGAVEINTTVPALNGGSNNNHVVNNKRVPPGGFSSGLW